VANVARDKAYYEAEKKSEEALKSGATILDLSHMKLTELPESIGQLTQLTEMYLSDNQLTTLPVSIGKLTQLRSLAISTNKISALPSSIGNLRNITELLIVDNRLTSLPTEIGQLTNLTLLDLSYNPLTSLPIELWQLHNLESLGIGYTKLTDLPKELWQLKNLKSLSLGGEKLKGIPKELWKLNQLTELNFHGFNFTKIPIELWYFTQLKSLGFEATALTELPPEIQRLTNLTELRVYSNFLSNLPAEIGHLVNLQQLRVPHNKLSDIPASIAQLEHLEVLNLDRNPLNPELAEAYKQGLDAVKAYLRAKVEGEIVLNEAKLILVGEGGVGKTSLLAALKGDEWVEKRETTHGVEVDITSLRVKDPDIGKEITLNGWDFGGQNIYRHTHQLFFTTPAVYLAVWEPRRGPEQSRVVEWIKMVKHRAYDESRPDERPRILVVATHGGPKERLDHIDEQAIRDEFGNLICGFYHVDSKPDENGVCYQLDQLKEAIGREAAAIPSVGRKVPVSWKKILEAIRRRSERDPYILYSRFEALCHRQGISSELVPTYATILNELGHLIYYRGDEALKDTVILKPDYLSKAISFVLEDKTTKDAKGLIEHHRLEEIWHDPARTEKERYPKELHPVFLRLMEKFDLSYQIVLPEAEAPPTSLMAQLVPGIRPEGWEDDWVLKPGDAERTHVCRILDSETGRTAEAEGLIYRLIVRLHRYSLGRKNYNLSRHWKTGLLLDDGFNGRAFIEEVGGDIYVTVRAAYPERFLSHLCSEIQWLVDHFWKGLDAKLFVPCLSEDCKGLLEIDEIMDFKGAGMPKVRCRVCTNFHEIDSLMATMQPKPIWDDAVKELRNGQQQILQAQDIGFDRLSTQLRVLMSQADEQYENLLAWLSDPARDGPRLFSIEPVKLSHFDPANWAHEAFRITLWCEYAKVPLPVLNGKGSNKGVYEINLTREWFKKAAPVLKFITTTASLILPVASAGLKLTLDEAIYKKLDFSKEVINASLGGFSKSTDLLTQTDLPKELRADASSLRELHVFLQKEDPTFGGLKRVQNKRREFLWVHEKFASEY
jgi:Leucine-rich repeat (LRR) protein